MRKLFVFQSEVDGPDATDGDEESTDKKGLKHGNILNKGKARLSSCESEREVRASVLKKTGFFECPFISVHFSLLASWFQLRGIRWVLSHATVLPLPPPKYRRYESLKEFFHMMKSPLIHSL
ncbi:UNVERIFIED_CONTAM: hypothetical protein NCL1_12994 [Trichonephila clavipes]